MKTINFITFLTIESLKKYTNENILFQILHDNEIVPQQWNTDASLSMFYTTNCHALISLELHLLKNT